MSRVIAALRDSVATLGWVNGLLYAVARGLEVGSGARCRLVKYYFVLQPVPAQARQAMQRAGRTRIYLAGPTDAIVRLFPRPPDVIARRFRDGAICLVAEKDGALVGFIWLKLEAYEEDEVRCRYRLDPSGAVAWDFDAYVEPPFRMTRAFVQLWEAANAFLRERGCRWSASRISAFNAASLAAHRRLDAVHLFTATFVLLGGTQLTLLSRAPFVHVGRAPAGRPTLDFPAPTASPANP